MVYGTKFKLAEFECYALNKNFVEEIEAPIFENFDTIRAYLFKQRFDKPYNELSWYLEDGAKDFVRELEDKF